MEKEIQDSVVFATVVLSSRASEINTLLLVESIRSFAGALSENPIWCLVPERGGQLSTTTREKFATLNVTPIPVTIDLEDPSFPFARTLVSLASAESMACGRTVNLAWLDNNTVVLQEPRDFVLQESKYLGYRPVHHTIIGSRYDQPLDAFWTAIYSSCNVSNDSIFPMTTHVDGARIRPYFNAGLLVTRPEKHLFRAWHDAFLRIYREASFRRFYELDKRYRVFIHQAVLSGVILSMFKVDDIHELPAKYNYPLHLLAQDNTANRPSGLEELVTFRHEGFYQDPDWIKKIPAEQSLKRWLTNHLAM